MLVFAPGGEVLTLEQITEIFKMMGLTFTEEDLKEASPELKALFK
jgi:hypothetical protein